MIGLAIHQEFKRRPDHGQIVVDADERIVDAFFNLRMARPGDVLRLLVGHGMRLVTVGIVVGVLAALMITRLMKTLLFGMSAADPATFIAISLILLFVAFLACSLPARRAAKVDPMTALRQE